MTSRTVLNRTKALFLMLAMLGSFSAVACAKDSAAKKEETKISSAKEAVLKDLRLIQAQEIRLVVLQQLFNQEAAVLKQKHTAFCQANKLDEEKFKKGLYRYDEASNKFNEISTPDAAAKK